MSHGKVYDWDTLRKAFVSGDMDLIALARETTNLESSPAYVSLKKRAAKEGWTDLRKTYQRNVVIQASSTTQAQDAIAKVDQLIDAAEAIQRHVQLAKSLQASYAAIQTKIKQVRAIEQMDFSELDPLQMSLLLQRLAAIAATGADIERKALGLSDPEQRVKVDASVNTNIDFSVMTDEELRRIAGS